MSNTINNQNEEILTSSSIFHFSCTPELPCFTKCCRDITIFLTPHDVLRMKNRLKINSWEFLDEFATVFYHKNNPFPFVQLKMQENSEHSCHFVEKGKGCQLYEDRPWSCRMYPLDLKEKGKYTLIVDSDKCKGLLSEREWLVSEWLENQGVSEFDELDYLYSALTEKEAAIGELGNKPSIREMVYMAAYDIDRFRKFVFESSFLKMFDIPEEEVDLLKTDDFELLKLGFKWIGFGIVNPMSIRIKADVIDNFMKDYNAKTKPKN